MFSKTTYAIGFVCIIFIFFSANQTFAQAPASSSTAPGQIISMGNCACEAILSNAAQDGCKAIPGCHFDTGSNNCVCRWERLGKYSNANCGEERANIITQYNLSANQAILCGITDEKEMCYCQPGLFDEMITEQAPCKEFCVSGYKLPNFLAVTDPALVIGNVIKYIIGISGSIALVIFLYGGFLWLISAGREAYVEKGKNTLIWSAVGLAIIFASYIIVNFVLNILPKG